MNRRKKTIRWNTQLEITLCTTKKPIEWATVPFAYTQHVLRLTWTITCVIAAALIKLLLRRADESKSVWYFKANGVVCGTVRVCLSQTFIFFFVRAVFLFGYVCHVFRRSAVYIGWMAIDCDGNNGVMVMLLVWLLMMTRSSASNENVIVAVILMLGIHSTHTHQTT